MVNYGADRYSAQEITLYVKYLLPVDFYLSVFSAPTTVNIPERLPCPAQ